MEAIFSLHGLGQALLSSLYRDPAQAQAVLLTATIVAVGLSLAVDLVAAAFVREWRTS